MLFKADPLSQQVDGDHYKNLPIQPVEYATRNRLGFIEGCVVKYVTRHRSKGGRKDIEKAIHFLQMLLELEYKEPPTFEELVASAKALAKEKTTIPDVVSTEDAVDKCPSTQHNPTEVHT